MKMTKKEIKLGTLYRNTNSLDVLFITKRWYYKSRLRKGETKSGWMVEYYYLDSPDEILGGIESYMLDRHEEVV